MSEERVAASVDYKELKKGVSFDFKYMQMTVIIINRFPKRESFDEANIITWNSELVDLQKKGKADFSLNLSGKDINSDSLSADQMHVFNTYIEHHVFASFLLLDKNMNRARHSDTACFYYESDF